MRICFALMTLATILASHSAADPKTPARPAKAPKLTSVYTPLYPSKQCKLPKGYGKPVGDDPLVCPGQRGYTVDLSFSAWATHVSINDGRGAVVTFSGHVADRLEWRLADGKPFAVIARVDQANEDDGASPANQPKLVIRGLRGFESITAELDATPKTAAASALTLVDAAYPGTLSIPSTLRSPTR